MKVEAPGIEASQPRTVVEAGSRLWAFERPCHARGMARTRWPDDHPNTKIQWFIDSSREVICSVPRSPCTDGTATMLDQIEALVDRQYVARTRADIDRLVSQVVPLVNEAVERVNVMTSQLQQLKDAKKGHDPDA